MPYIQVQLEITPAQQRQALKGARIKLTPDAIGKGRIVMLHPLNAKKVATRKGGVMLELSPGEIMTTASYHDMMPNVPEGVSGSGFLDNAWQLLKKGGKWLKDSGVGSVLADVAQTAATPFIGETGAQVARDILKTTTGVGLKMRGKGMHRMAKGSGLYL
jgi:hypothetical protein